MNWVWLVSGIEEASFDPDKLIGTSHMLTNGHKFLLPELRTTPFSQQGLSPSFREIGNF